jgi:hypothetical protein
MHRGTAIAALSGTLLSLAPGAAFGQNDPAGLKDLDRALSWIPETAISFVVVPQVKAASDDLAALVEAMGQGGFLAMGRPVDVLKAQFGIGANLDEKAPIAVYFPPSTEAVDGKDGKKAESGAAGAAGGASDGNVADGNVADGEAVDGNAAFEAFAARPVVVLGVTDADAFLAANLTVAPDKGEGAYTTSNGMVVFARKLDGRVALGPTPESLPTADARGIGERFRARLKPDEAQWLARADLVAWGSRDAMHAAAEAGRNARIPEVPAQGAPGGFGGSREQQEAFRAKSLEVIDMLADGVIVVDIDPLGVFIGSVGVAEPSSPLAAVTAGGAGSPAKFDRLPGNPFYLALAADLDGLGGAAKLGELLDFGGISRAVLPEWVFTDGADLRSLQFAAYPSKLGVAIGGALNDSTLFVSTRNPAGTVERIRQSIAAFAGEANGVRREPNWTAEKKLKSGDTATAFELKETVFDAAQRPGLDTERLVQQFIFGSRGLNGLLRQSADGVVITFSQRPDVLSRAVGATQGGKTLANDPTVQSIEEWLPVQRDVEVMVGVGQLVNLGTQIASSFVSEEQLKALVPPVDKDAEPIALTIDIDGGRVRSAIVLPAAVLKIAASAGARAGRGGAGGGGPAEVPSSQPRPPAGGAGGDAAP